MKRQKLLALLLALCMAVSMLPIGSLSVGASAIDGAPEEHKAALQAAMDAIDAIGTVTYKSLEAIQTAETAYAAVPEESRSYIADYASTLTSARSSFNAIIEAYDFTITSNRPGSKGYINAWLATCSDEVFDATRSAISDTIKYQYYKGRNIGFTNGGTSNDFSDWMDSPWMIITGGSDDNYNKQEWGDRQTTTVPVFPGIAFSVDSTFSQNWEFQSAYPAGENFKMDGKIYQVFRGYTKSYDASIEPSAAADLPAIEKSGNHPEERANDGETNKNIFLYAYAKYSQDNRWAGLTLGVPQSEWAQSVGNTRYQTYEGPQGPAYILTTLDKISAAPTDGAQDSYIAGMNDAYVLITGDMAGVIAGINDFFNRSGELVSADASSITFENGTLTAEGFAEADTAAAGRVSALITALPDAAEVQAYDQTAIEAARSEYDLLSVTAQELVTNYSRLTEAEAALEEILSASADAAEVVTKIAAIGTVTYKSLSAISEAQKLYDALSEESKSYVSNHQILVDAQASFNAIIEAYDFTITSNRPGSKGYINAWLATCSDEVFDATRSAISDTIKYQYYKGRNIGFTNGGTSNDFSDWMDSPWMIITGGSDDNYNKQEWGDRQTTTVPVFPGIAFSVDSTFSQNWEFQSAYPAGENFKMDGKIYQVFRGYTKSYDASIEPSAAADLPAIEKSGNHPEERANDGETNKNIFLYAYAKYSQDNRWAGLTLGVPQSEWAQSVGNTRYQTYEGPQGPAYILTTLDKISAAPTDGAQDSYIAGMNDAYVLITGDMAGVIAGINDFFNRSGELVSADASSITFENATVTANDVIWNYADYTAVDTALEKVAAFTKEDYTEASWAKLQTAVNAVVRNLMEDEQATVDGYAVAIEEAILALVPISVEMNLTIGTGMVTAAAEGKYDITWNAHVLVGDTLAVEDINTAGVKFKNYGVYYSTGKDVLADYKNASADQIRKIVFAQGENVDIYTSYGFRLKNVVENRVRAAMFYIEYELDGQNYILLSTVDEVVAVIAE